MTTPTNYTKFGFDTEFFELVQGAGGVGGSPAQQKVVAEEMRQQAYQEGYAAGVIEGQKQAQADLAQLQQHLQNTIMSLQAAQKEREDHLLTQMLALLRVTLHQMVGQISSVYGPELLEHHLRAVLPVLLTDESLTLRIHPIARGFHEKLGLPQASIMGLPMHVTSDSSLGPTDVVVQWANGGVESKLEQHLQLVDALLAGAGAPTLPVTGRTNVNPVPVTPAAAPHQEPAPEADMETEAARAAKARADALLGDDGDLVDALK